MAYDFVAVAAIVLLLLEFLKYLRNAELGRWSVDQTSMEMTVDGTLVGTWRRLLGGSGSSWVLFENGTCVILSEPYGDLVEQAIELLREWGPVYAGSPSGDFSVLKLRNGEGWVVTCHHRDILTFVGLDEFVPGNASDISVGLTGRSKRTCDAESLRVIHVEEG